MPAKRVDGEPNKRRRPPATTPEGRQMQLEAYAYDLAEKRLLNETASASEVVYFLKASSSREKLELKRLEIENKLSEAKIDQISATQGQAELLERAMRAFTEYRGQDVTDEE